MRRWYRRSWRARWPARPKARESSDSALFAVAVIALIVVWMCR